MTPVWMLLLAQVAHESAVNECDVRRVSFSDYTFLLPARSRDEAPRLQDVSGQERREWRLRNGYLRAKGVEDGSGYAAITMRRKVEHGDLTGDGVVEAVVALDAESGGSQHRGFVVVLSCVQGAVRTLATFATGDRSQEGLRKAVVVSGELVIEVNDPGKATADCCSSGRIRHRYRFGNGRFLSVGKPEFLEP